MINLGDRVRDRITGLEGVVVGVTDWLYGCRRPYVQPDKLDKDGKPIEAMVFDEPQLELLEVGVLQAPVLREEPLARTGGPRPNPQRRPNPQYRPDPR